MHCTNVLLILLFVVTTCIMHALTILELILIIYLEKVQFYVNIAYPLVHNVMFPRRYSGLSC